MMHKLKLAVFYIAKMIGLFDLASWLSRNHLKILCYHGFALQDEVEFRPGLFISSKTFESRLETLGRYGIEVLPLAEGVDRLYAGTLPRRALVITVDDGFHSVLRLAAPALARRSLPATVYVTTYYVEHANPIFRLAIQYMFWKTSKQTLGLQNIPWSTDTMIDLSDPANREQATWNCIRYGETQCTEEQRREISFRVGELLDVSYAEIEAARILHLMTPEELRELTKNGIDVQLHTHRHTFPQTDQISAEREIADNRAALTRILGERAFEHFCYPSGLWAEHQWEWLDRMRVKSSTTCLHGLNSRASPPHALRRFVDAEDIHPLEFEAFLTGFSEVSAVCRRLIPFIR